MKRKKNTTYVKETFVMINMMKRNLKYTKQLEIIGIKHENLEKQLIAFAIYIMKYPKKFL